jgi:MYXO-CTERM domain-containing protein
MKRAGQFWAGIEAGDSDLTNLPLTLLGFAGLGMTRRRRSLAILYLLPLVLFPLPYYITHVYVRYQYVIDPILAVLAGHAVAVFLGEPKIRNAVGTNAAGHPRLVV